MRSEIDARLAELRTALEDARQMPMSASVIVNRTEMLELVRALELAITEGLAHASQVLGERAAVVASGHDEAAEIVRLAQLEREKLASDTDVYRLAREKADVMVHGAQVEAAALRREAEEYVESQLANFEVTLGKTLETVRRGLSRLRGGHAAGLSEED